MIQTWSAAAGCNLDVFRTSSNNALVNLATEEWLLTRKGAVDGGKRTLFLWRNTPTVVIGAHQNAYAECNLAAMERDNVTLARRHTGGGAVYHDLGNSIFSFLSPAIPSQGAQDKQTRAINNGVLIRALDKLGFKGAQSSGRNDLTLNGRKISGCAFRTSRGVFLHHGTMLVSTDLTALAKYLTPSTKKLQSKGVDSVRSRVANLLDLSTSILVNHEKICTAIADEFRDTFRNKGNVVIQELELSRVMADPEFQAMLHGLESWKWRYGNNPQFSTGFDHRFEWGSLDLRLDVKDGCITDVVVFSDTLVPITADSIKLCLTGKTFRRKEVTLALTNMAQSLGLPSEAAHQITDVCSWLSPQIAN